MIVGVRKDERKDGSKNVRWEEGGELKCNEGRARGVKMKGKKTEEEE